MDQNSNHEQSSDSPQEHRRPLRLLPRSSRKEDEFVASFKEMLAVVTRAYDMTGDPSMQGIRDRARAVLGRVPG